MFGQDRSKFVMMDARSQDHAAIADLHRQSFPRGWSESEISALALQPAVTIIIARTVGEPEGPVLGFNIVRHTQDEAEILSIAVDPKGRGRGLGGIQSSHDGRDRPLGTDTGKRKALKSTDPGKCH